MEVEMMTVEERNDMREALLSHTLLDGQPVPKSLKDALRQALTEIEEEDRQVNDGPPGDKVADMEDRPWTHRLPGTRYNIANQGNLERQEKMVNKMRKRLGRNAERAELAKVNPDDAEHCKRYN